MSFLKEMLRDKKLLELEVELDTFLSSQEINDDTMMYAMSFDKEVYASEEEVREFLKDKYLSFNEIIEEDKNFSVTLTNAAQFNDDSKKEIDLRRGVKCSVGDLMSIPQMSEMAFNEKGEVNLSSKLGSINLNMGVPSIIEIARVSEGEHPAYGKIKITKEILKSFELNFKSNATGVDLPVNEDHKKFEAFGWFKDVFLSMDGSVCYGQVGWNSKGIKALDGKEYRYFSPEFRFNYVHPHTQKEHGPTLLGGALTNYPFLKMEAITELNNKPSKETKMSNETISLNDHKTEVIELNGKINTLTSDVNKKDAEIVELNEKVAKLEKEKEQAKKEAVHQKLFTENKISKAQMVALNEGKGMLEVLALNEKLNPEAQGNDGEGKQTVELSAKDKEFADALGLTAEEFALGNK